MRTLTMTRIGPWNVRLVFKGEQHGRDDCLTHDADEPLIEFHDAEQRADKFGPRGQFVSRYNASTVLSMDAARGLCLDFGQPRWNVQPGQLAAIIDWAANQCIYEGGK